MSTPPAELEVKKAAWALDPKQKQCLKRVARDEARSVAVTYQQLRSRGLAKKAHYTTGSFKGWELTPFGRQVCAFLGLHVPDDDHPAAPAPVLPDTEATALVPRTDTPFEKARAAKEAKWTEEAFAAPALERRVATILCQYNRITRDMPSAAEIGRALPHARSLIKEVREAS